MTEFRRAIESCEEIAERSMRTSRMINAPDDVPYIICPGSKMLPREFRGKAIRVRAP
jgi:hypothetical protein